MTTVVAALEDLPYLQQQYLAGKASEAEEVPMNAIGVQPSTLLVEDGVSTLTLNAAGTGYHELDILTLVQASASGCRIRVDTVDVGNGHIDTWTLLTPGEGYAVATALATTVVPSGGANATFNVTAVADRTVIDAYTITKSVSDVVTAAEVDSSQYKFEIENVTFVPEDVSNLTFA